MIYEADELIKELNQFKIDALLRLNTIEMRLSEVDTTDKQIQKDIDDLRHSLIKETDDINEKIEYIRQEMPSASTNKIMFSIFGGTIAFAFAIILNIIRV